LLAEKSNMFKKLIRSLLQNPELNNDIELDIDDPVLRRKVLLGKAPLKELYLEWYNMIIEKLPDIDGKVVEIGAGGGIFRDNFPSIITTDIKESPYVNIVSDGMALPFANNSLRGIVMTNVFHHFNNPRNFLYECTRTLKPKGVVLMIEPWVTPWSKLIFRMVHHEPFYTNVTTWDGNGSETYANNAIPWIVFKRDRKMFEKQFPQFLIEDISPVMPLSYLLSGGIAIRPLLPVFALRLLRKIEIMVKPINTAAAMFSMISLRKLHN
jgi:SAM-dependent methyltransferase